ncbi:MAG TPA: SDR family NAD(P)-dependent oxidoreductase, partial [Candidatus Krumholzibacteria bacterium]
MSFLKKGGDKKPALPPRVERSYQPAANRFDGKVAVVTGASAGIGLHAALALAREGAKVALIARREAEGNQALERVKSLGAEGMFLQADVSDASQVRNAFARISEQFGCLDVAFNNAGVQQKNGAIANVDEAEFDRVMQTNVK